MITIEGAVSALQSLGEPQKAADMRKYHKAPRPYFGASNPAIYDTVQSWRDALPLEDRLSLAAGLWDTNIHECRVAAARLLVQARIKPDDAAWALITSWVPQFDAWAIADHVCGAGARRLSADPKRLDEVEGWTTSDHMWTKRAALVMTLPWTKIRNPKPEDLASRERILGWAAAYTTDPAWFIQKSVSWWLRELGRHDPARVRRFLAEHGDAMKPFARKDASRKLPPA